MKLHIDAVLKLPIDIAARLKFYLAATLELYIAAILLLHITARSRLYTHKKQGAVSHSSTEAEVISLDAALRLEGTACLTLWDIIISTFTKQPSSRKVNPTASGNAAHSLPLQQESPRLYSVAPLAPHSLD